MITTHLNDPGTEHDGVSVLLCIASANGCLDHNTCVRDDNTIPVGSFGPEEGPLFDLDIYDGHSAWVFKTLAPIGYIRNNLRLRLLLGEKVTVGKWTIRPR